MFSAWQSSCPGMAGCVRPTGSRSTPRRGRSRCCGRMRGRTGSPGTWAWPGASSGTPPSTSGTRLTSCIACGIGGRRLIPHWPGGGRTPSAYIRKLSGTSIGRCAITVSREAARARVGSLAFRGRKGAASARMRSASRPERCAAHRRRLRCRGWARSVLTSQLASWAVGCKTGQLGSCRPQCRAQPDVGLCRSKWKPSVQCQSATGGRGRQSA